MNHPYLIAVPLQIRDLPGLVTGILSSPEAKYLNDPVSTLSLIYYNRKSVTYSLHSCLPCSKHIIRADTIILCIAHVRHQRFIKVHQAPLGGWEGGLLPPYFQQMVHPNTEVINWVLHIVATITSTL